MIQTGLVESEMGIVVESGASDDAPMPPVSSLESCGDSEAVPVAFSSETADKTPLDASAVVESIVESGTGSASAASSDWRAIPWVEEVAIEVEVFGRSVGDSASEAPVVDDFKWIISTSFSLL